jgi:hypothetical protein
MVLMIRHCALAVKYKLIFNSLITEKTRRIEFLTVNSTHLFLVDVFLRSPNLLIPGVKPVDGVSGRVVSHCTNAAHLKQNEQGTS